MKTTEQVKKVPNPTGKGGFGDNPQNRNNGGRVKNTLKEFQRQEFEKMSDDEKRAYLETIDSYKKWAMAEGNPENNTDITSKGQAILVTAQEAIDRHAISRDTEQSNEG